MKNLSKPSLYWLFIFAPAAILLEKAGVNDSLVFFAAALSIIPIAKMIGASTENLAHHTGDAIGGLLNATFGNLPELITATVLMAVLLMAVISGDGHSNWYKGVQLLTLYLLIALLFYFIPDMQ
jgi:Ca2+/H+ antiporter